MRVARTEALARDITSCFYLHNMLHNCISVQKDGRNWTEKETDNFATHDTSPCNAAGDSCRTWRSSQSGGALGADRGTVLLRVEVVAPSSWRRKQGRREPRDRVASPRSEPSKQTSKQTATSHPPCSVSLAWSIFQQGGNHIILFRVLHSHCGHTKYPGRESLVGMTSGVVELYDSSTFHTLYYTAGWMPYN